MSLSQERTTPSSGTTCILANDATMEHYLRVTDIIDWQHPQILQQASILAASVTHTISDAESGRSSKTDSLPSHGPNAQALDIEQWHWEQEQWKQYAIAQACFKWVCDTVHHSFDYQLNPITCKASDVLKHRTDYCYAKSHLLGALLRANGIAAGFCYQR